jgi:hypothetical protein
MRQRIFDIIAPVEEDMPLCNLGYLFNGYMSRLSSLEVQAYPMETLGEYHKLAIGPIKNLRPADRDKARALRACQERYYFLSVVNNSLHDLHLCVLGACNTLSDLFNLYDGDLQRYAIQNRLQIIASTVPGSDEEMREDSEFYAEFIADWEPADPSKPDGLMKVKYKDDAESLAPYTLAADLAQFFAPLIEDRTIERIGATLPEEWDFLTETVRAHSAKQIKTSQLSENAGVYRANAAGVYEQQSVAQRVENEVNDEMKDVRVASYFQQIMRRLQFVSGLSVMLTDVQSYRELLAHLVAIRDCTGLAEPAEPFA